MHKKERIKIQCLEAPKQSDIKLSSFTYKDDAKDENGLAVMAVDADNYKIQAEWLARVIEALKRKNKVIQYYKDCILNYNSRIEDN